MITKTIFSSVVKKSTHLQNIVKAVETKIPEVQNVEPTRVVMQEVGDKTISEVTYDNRKVTVISNKKEEVIKTFEEPLPEKIVPGTVETTITKEGVKTVTASNPETMQVVEPVFKEVLPEVVKQTPQEQIKTVVSKETSFGQVFTIVVEKPEETQPQQTTYYYNKDTKKVVNMGTEEIPVAPQPVSEPAPSKPVPETKWTTEEVKPVIKEITKTVSQEKVTKVEELKPTPTVRFYQVTVDTPKGPEVIKMTVDKTTKEVQVIEKRPEVVSQPQQPSEPQQPKPSTTTVTVDETTGVKTTSTTDSTVIKQDSTVKKVEEAVVKQAPELKNTPIVSSTTKEYDTTVESRVVFKSDTTSTRVVSVVNKKTQEVKIIDKAPVSSVEDVPSEVKITKNTIDEVVDKDDILRRAIKFVGSKLPKFQETKPSSVSYEELPNIIRYTLVYTVSSTNYRVVVIYTKTTKEFELVEQPSEVQDVKPVVLEQQTTAGGKKVVFTNDVESLTKIDSNFQQMVKELTKDYKITQDDISSVKSTQTSTGNTYSIITTKGD